MSDELKECPFCGAEPFVQQHEPHTHSIATFMPDYPGSVTIECPKCSCGMIHDTEAEAVAAWNCRAPAAPAVQEPIYCTPTEHEGRIVYEHTSAPIPMADSFKLYAAPVPAIPPELTDAQIDALARDSCHSDPKTESGEYCLTVDELRAMLAATPPSPVPTYHCNICGGQVDLNNATKPTADFSTAGRAWREQSPVPQDVKDAQRIAEEDEMQRRMEETGLNEFGLPAFRGKV